MKNIFLTVLFICLLMYSVTAQITGGGNNKQKNKTEKTYGVLKNTHYITLTRSSAVGDFKDNVDSYSDIERGSGGMSKGSGIDFGKIFYLNNVDMGSDIKLGIDVTYVNLVIFFSLQNDISSFVAVKVGPVISFNPTSKLVIDIKFAFQPSYLIYNQRIASEEDDYYDYYGYYDDGYDDFKAGGFKIRTGLGVYARYRPFTLGFELNFGKVKLRSFDLEYDDFKIKTGRFDFVFGVAF